MKMIKLTESTQTALYKRSKKWNLRNLNCHYFRGNNYPYTNERINSL